MVAAQIGTYRAYLERMTRKRLPVKLAFAIGLNADELENYRVKLEEQRLKMAQNYAEKNEDGTPQTKEENGKKVFVFTDENLKAFQGEYAELLTQEVEGINIRKVPEAILEQLDQDKYDTLTVGEIRMLQFMIE